ncbi:MAG TPA: TonB-dependent receptor [Terriglobales bacterium]|nr:TonB-dependent receptor [Terriglobales bacterium]
MQRHLVNLVVLGVVFGMLFVLPSAAQVQYGQFAGIVTDPTGAAIASAKVTAINSATGLSVSATTNSSGNYAAKELPVGSYKLTVEATGFKTESSTSVTVNAGTIAHVDFKLQIGKASEIVEVTGAASQINTEDSKLSTTVSSAEIANLPLNGRNVYDLMQQAPGAVNVNGTMLEAGHGTVVNGVREDFNGFLINGVSNKDLSGGVNNTPIQDTVEEFQQLQLNMSAQYGSSAGSVNNLVTKSGTNQIHGSVWEYLRNSAMDANEYFVNQQGAPKPPLRFNQFGGTFGAPIIKDKLFVFGAYQGDRFKTTGLPGTITVESPAWEQAVQAGSPNSVAALLYKNFAPSVAGTQLQTLDQFVPGSSLNSAIPDYTGYLCNSAIAAKLIPIIGVTAQDVANAAQPNNPLGNCALAVTPQAPGVTFSRSASSFLNTSTAVFGAQAQVLGNLINGNEGMGRVDYNWSSNNRMYVAMNYDHNTDSFGGLNCNNNCTRGFKNPNNDYFQNAQFSWVHTFSPTVLNEFKLGYTQNNTQIAPNLPGVPQITFTDNVTGFGSYSGYPQAFKDHEYSYGDLVSISHGNHNIKVGADLRRNLENSVFNVARPNYYFSDPLFFAADTPGGQAAGVDPDLCTAVPCTTSTLNASPNPELRDNVRHWRNWEVGAFAQDDWKATKRLTLNLGLRWDFYKRHTEEDNLATTFKFGPGSTLAQQVASANSPLGSAGCNPATIIPDTQTLAGVCGPGGFAASSSLGPNQFHDFGPRVGFAWDVFGNGKTSVRGGFGISYEGTLYNPLSNSRWNLPYYSFNAVGSLEGIPGTIVYGPSNCAGVTPGTPVCPASGAAPTFTGAGNANNPGQGVGAQAVGNLSGWFSGNIDAALLTGFVPPQGLKDPYVYNFFFGIQREIAPKIVVEANYVGTAGHRLFRSQQLNRQIGGGLPEGSCVTNNLGNNVCSLVDNTIGSTGAPINPAGVPNPNYGVLREWQNANNSNYNALQLSLRKQMSHGFTANVNYTYSHTIDNGSSWHDSATSAAGGAGGDGYSTDTNDPGLDRGNSVFDIRHRLVLNYVYQLPGQNLHGVMGAIAGGWSLNGIWSFQSGPHWSPYVRLTGATLVEPGTGNPCSAADVSGGNCINTGGEWSLDGQFPGVDRPDSSVQNFSPSRSTWAHGWPANTPGGFSFLSGNAPANYSAPGFPTLSAPCLACVGNLGRNTFVGPGQWSADMTLAKVFKLTERFNLKFEAAAFNIFNRANFILSNGSAFSQHNSLDDPLFGEAGGTLNARNLQVGLKVQF